MFYLLSNSSIWLIISSAISLLFLLQFSENFRPFMPFIHLKNLQKFWQNESANQNGENRFVEMKWWRSKTFLLKIKGLLKKGLRKFQRDVAKFSLSLGFLNTTKREITIKSLAFSLKSVIKARFYRYFPQIYRFSGVFSWRCTRTTLRLMNFTRFSRVKVCIFSSFGRCKFQDNSFRIWHHKYFAKKLSIAR